MEYHFLVQYVHIDGNPIRLFSRNPNANGILLLTDHDEFSNLIILYMSRAKKKKDQLYEHCLPRIETL